MNIPKKIFPDRIREAVVEVRYQSGLPFEILLGIFFNALDETYSYNRRQPQLQQSDINNVTIQMGGQINFYNDKINIQVIPNALVFTCLNGTYIGWDNYFPEIRKVIQTLMFGNKSTKIEKYVRIGVRYISEYPKQFLSECTKFNFSFGLPEVKSDTYIFRTEFMYDSAKVILNLNNMLPVIKNEEVSNSFRTIPTSSIDVDVILENLDIKTDEDIFLQIENAHQKEKYIFFSMLKEDFLQTLNPQY